MIALTIFSMEIKPITLEGNIVSPGTSFDESPQWIERCWNGQGGLEIPMTVIRTRGDMERYIESALQLQKQGSALPFAIIEKSTGRATGSAQYGNIDMENRRV